MPKDQLRFATLAGLMVAIEAAGPEKIEQYGVQKEDFEKVTSDIVWMGQDRAQVTRTIDALMFGACDAAGISRFQIPAEYIAATIAFYCHPTNYMIACNFMEGSMSMEDLVLETNSRESVKASRMFAMICELQTEHVSKLKARYEKRTKNSLSKVTEIAA